MRIDRYIALVFNFTLLIIVTTFVHVGHAQITGSSSGNGLESPVNYQARDSIVADIPNEIVRLYGEANVQYEGVDLKADLIEIDLATNEVIATYTLDSLGNPVGKPIFSSDGEESRMDYIKYNFDTKKGFIKEVRMQQGEGYIHMAKSKVHPNEEIHFKAGKFTTCDKEKPHYHFNLTRAIVVPEKRIVTGPVYMEILKVPTPLAAPFGFFPNSDTKKAGLIIPRLATTDRYGFGLEDLGYYFPLGDYWETYFYGSIFTTGRWSLQNITNYYRKYKSKGNFGIKFEQLRGKFYDPLISQKWTLNWAHNQDPKAHPTLKFTSNINFVSDNTAKTSLDVINPNYFDNTFNSSINVTKSWRLGKFNGSMGLQSSLRQNSQSKNYVMELPRYNLSVSRFNFGVLRKSTIGEKWYEKINVTYSMNARNSITAPDSIFNVNDIGQVREYAKNGIEHKTILQSNLRLFGGRFTFTPSANYREFWNFQSESRAWNSVTEKVDTTAFRGFKSARDISFAGTLNSNFFGYYKMKGKNGVKFRHVASPTVNFTYRPDIGLYEEIQIDTNGNLRFYSPFEQSLYRETSRGTSGAISFGLNNTLEMKKRAKNDTINGTLKSFKLIDAFSINGGYDFLRDSLNLSNFRLAFRTARFLNVFSFQSDATLSPYSWIDSTGVSTATYAWEDNHGIGRFKTAKATLNASFSNKKGIRKNIAEQAKDNKPKTEPTGDPKVGTSAIPWLLNLSYNINYVQTSLTNNLGALTDTFTLVQTIRGDGNFNFNEKWKLDYLVNVDLQTRKLSNLNIGLWRDLHCWETSIFYQQFGPFFNPDPDTNPNFKVNWSILFKIGIKASMFQDIKYDQTFTNPF